MSGARVDLSLDESGLQSKLSQITEGWEGHREAILLALAEDLVGNLKDDAPTNTGRLKGTIRALESDSRKYTVVAGGEDGVDYTLPVIEGSEPHAPGAPTPGENPSLARWADRNGYPGGFEGIYWHIYHYGTEPNDFVSGALESTRDESSGIASQVLRNREVIE